MFGPVNGKFTSGFTLFGNVSTMPFAITAQICLNGLSPQTVHVVQFVENKDVM